MSKVIAIVSSLAHVHMMTRVLDSLSEYRENSWKMVSLDAYYREGHTAELLRQKGFPYVILGPRNIPESRIGFRFGSNWHRMALILEARRYIRDLLNKEKPEIIVLGSDVSPIEKLFIQAGKRKGIPLLLVQDGILSRHEHTDHGPKPNSIGGWLKRYQRWIFRKCLDMIGILPKPTNYGLGGCTRIAVMGEVARDILIERGVAPEKIVITGQPRYDEIINNLNTNEENVLDYLRMAPGERFILFASFLIGRSRYGTAKDDETTLHCLVNLAQSFGERFSIVIKPHPLDPIEDYHKYLQDFKARKKIKIVENFDTLSLIKASSLVITFGSTVAYEALILNKPVLFLNLTHLPDPLDLAKEGFGIAVHSPQECKEVAQAILFDDVFRERLLINRQSILERHLYRQDGRAGERVAEQILELLHGRNIH